MRLALRGLFALSVAFGSFGLGMGALGADAAPILVGRISGDINPITARYVDRVVSDGEATRATAVVFVIDTPGGLVDATYKITARLLAAKVPVVTYVAPSGARAASAGTFITLAGHVAAMAPATSIGAAHPVDSNGADIQGDLRQKVENDAVDHIVNIAKARGRNESWAEDAVRKSASARADDAVAKGIVDLLADDVRDLVAKLDGRTVKTADGDVRLQTASAPLEDDGQNPLEAFLHFIVNPQIAVLLFTLGTYGLIFELSNPGLIFPGIVGVIAILLALFAFGTLDANGAGIAFMVFAVVLFALEIKLPAHGLLTVGGIISLVFGLVILFPPFRPTFPGIRATVDPAIIALVVAVTAGFFIFLIRMAARLLQLPGVSTSLLGVVGVAKSDIAPQGIAYVGSEDWTALSESGAIPRGSKVRVKRVEGVRLIVEPAQAAELRGRT